MNAVWIAVAVLAVAAVLAAVLYGLHGADSAGKRKRENKTASGEPRKIEPVVNAAAEKTQTAAPPQPLPPQPQPSQGNLEIASSAAPEIPPPPEETLASEMCYAAHVFAPRPLAAEAFAPLAEQWKKWRLPRHILLGYAEQEKQWREPSADSPPRKNWILAAPLADRNGALDEKRIRDLEESARRFCQSIGARGKFPSVAESVKNAKLLDEFCNSVDKIVEMHLSGSPSLARVAEAAKIGGLSAADASGIKYVCRQNSETLFSMTVYTRARGEVRRVVFELDAPNVSNSARAFDAMTRCLQKTASMLSLEITDGSGAAVDDERLEQMREQLALLNAEMKKFGVPPGGAIARLLFS